jgi:hypothetical protein
MWLAPTLGSLPLSFPGALSQGEHVTHMPCLEDPGTPLHIFLQHLQHNLLHQCQHQRKQSQASCDGGNAKHLRQVARVSAVPSHS